MRTTQDQTVYVCDQCGAEWVIGQFNRPEAINSLHPPRSWWRLAPADSSMLWEDRRTHHLCSDECLSAFAAQKAKKVPA